MRSEQLIACRCHIRARRREGSLSTMEGNGDGDMANTVVGHGGEVLTVQVGGFSNLVAAHYWNAQTAQFMFGATEEASDQEDTDGQSSDDVNTPTGARRPVIDVAHDCLFRAGSAALDGRVTYLPRTVVVDLNGVVPQVRIYVMWSGGVVHMMTR